MSNVIFSQFHVNFTRILINSHCTRRLRTIRSYKQLFAMDKAYVRIPDDSDRFDITFRYSNPQQHVDRRFNFNRALDEDTAIFLARIATNIGKILNKKNKRKKKSDVADTTPESDLEVKLLHGNVELPSPSTCRAALDCGDLFLQIADRHFRVHVNSPWVDALNLPKSIMAGFPTYPCKYDAVFCDKTRSQYTWYTSANQKQWDHVGDRFLYTPSNGDVGKWLKLVCVPRNGERIEGPTVEDIAEVKVDAGPGECPFEQRHLFTTQRTDADCCRVVSYNLLADLYCDSDFSRTELFPYCPAYALDIDYRKQLFLKELIGYNSDLICLQEVDRKIYNYDLQPVFADLNYESVFHLKGGSVAEGLCCIFTNDKFRLLEAEFLHLGDAIDKNELFADIWQAVKRNQQLLERVTQRQTIVQIVVLAKRDADEIVLVANIHCYFHPDADHIRLLQGSMAIRYINSVRDRLKAKYPDKRTSIIFCGDFNSVPSCGIYELYTTGSVSETNIDWRSNEQETVEGLSVTQPLRLQSACGTPDYTNYTHGFNGCLDYIYYGTDNLRVTQVIPLPTHEEVTANVAIPSVVFPSDHIALVADLQWIQN